MSNSDPYVVPAYPLLNRAARFFWLCACFLLFRYSPKIFWSWRVWILRCFGAKIGKGCAIHQSVRIWAPWNLHCEDTVAVAEFVEIYNPSLVSLGSHSIVSQGAYLCAASHDFNTDDFVLFSRPISLHRYSWVCARACVVPGVTLMEGAVLGLGSVATKDLQPWSVYAGVPARFVKTRKPLRLL